MITGDDRDGVVDALWEPVPDGHAASEAQRIARFMEWLPELGATTSAVVLDMTPHGRQLCARHPIKKGALVMHIPRTAMILVDEARDSTIGLLIQKHKVKLTIYGALAAYLLDLRRRGEAWGPFLDILPGAFDEHPFCLAESDLDLLQASWILPSLRRRRARMEKEYAALRACLPDEYAFSREDYVWASCCAWTRVYTVRIDGRDTHALVPMGDMLDHELDANVRWSREVKLGFLLTAARDIDVGEPLTMHYWSAGNARMFATFGFCLTHNPNDVALLRLPALPPWHPCFEAARSLGEQEGAHRVFMVPAVHALHAVRDMFAYLRLAALGQAPRADAGAGPYDRANEEEALASLALACRQRLAEFPTTLEHDEVLLQDSGLPLGRHFAVRVRHGEKAVLRYFLELTEAALSGARSDAVAARHADYFSVFDKLSA